jgi:DNA-binding FadR family transcriptional regulator
MPSATAATALDLDAIVFAPLVGEALVPHTARRLREAIACGLLVPGQRLPAEPDLSERLHISPATLREALAVLRQDGLLVTRRGRGGGTFIAEEIPVAAYTYADTEAEREQVRDLAEYRRALVAQAALAIASSVEDSALPSVTEGVDDGNHALPPSALLARKFMAFARASRFRRLWVEVVETEMSMSYHFLALGLDGDAAEPVVDRIDELWRSLPTMDAVAARRSAAQVADAASALLLDRLGAMA